MNDLTTSLLLICAATTFAAGLVVAQRRLVANIARRFLALPRVEQAPLVVAVGVMTVCAQKSGTNGVSNAEKTESQRRGEEESTVQSGSGLQAASQEEGDALNEGGSGVSPLQQEEVNVLSRSGQETASTLKVSVTTNDIARGYAFVEARTNAKVTFTGDGASNLADPTFIAKAGETNRVTLLIGKSYQATCAFPFEIVGRSSTSIEVSRPSDRAADVCWPVKISVDGQNSSGAANAVALASDAAIVNATVGAKIKYAGQAPSGAADDVVVRGTFAEAGGEGEPIESEATLTSVRVDITAVEMTRTPMPEHRRTFGVREIVSCRHEPSSADFSFSMNASDAVTDLTEGRVYCPWTGGTYVLRMTVRNAAYFQALRVVEPRVVCREAVWNGVVGTVGCAGQVGMNLSLYVEPSTVSFSGVYMVEVADDEVGVRTGYFADGEAEKVGELSHTEAAGAGVWIQVHGDEWAMDAAGRATIYPTPWCEGRKEWRIPVGWGDYLHQLKGSVRPDPTTQVFTLKEDGTASVSKYGHVIERRTDNKVYLDGVLQD